MSLWDAIDAAEVTTTKKEFSLLPEGDYKAQITDVECKEEVLPEFMPTQEEIEENKDNPDFDPFAPNQITFKIEFTIIEGAFAKRKCWWTSKFNKNTSDKSKLFIKAMICKAAGIESTKGNPAEALQSAKGNYVEINVQHKPGVKDPSKTFLNVYIN